MTSSTKSPLYVAVWEWQNSRGAWRPYSPEVSQHLERGRHKNLSSLLLGDADPRLTPYVVNLISMKQIHQESGTAKCVRQSFLPQRSPAGSGVVWQWRGDPGEEWHDYGMPVQCIVEDAWAQGSQTVDISQYFPEYPFIVDFCNLTQHILGTNTYRPVRRQKQASYPVAKPPPGYTYTGCVVPAAVTVGRREERLRRQQHQTLVPPRPSVPKQDKDSNQRPACEQLHGSGGSSKSSFKGRTEEVATSIFNRVRGKNTQPTSSISEIGSYGHSSCRSKRHSSSSPPPLPARSIAPPLYSSTPVPHVSSAHYPPTPDPVRDNALNHRRASNMCPASTAPVVRNSTSVTTSSAARVNSSTAAGVAIKPAPPVPLPRSLLPPKPLPRTLLPSALSAPRSPPYHRVPRPELSPCHTMCSYDSINSGRRSSIETISTYLSTDDMPQTVSCSNDACVAHLLDFSLDECSSAGCGSSSSASVCCAATSNRSSSQPPGQRHPYCCSSSASSSSHDMLLIPISRTEQTGSSHSSSLHRLPVSDDDDDDGEVFTSADQEVRRVMSATITQTRRHVQATASAQ